MNEPGSSLCLQAVPLGQLPAEDRPVRLPALHGDRQPGSHQLQCVLLLFPLYLAPCICLTIKLLVMACCRTARPVSSRHLRVSLA